MINFSVVDVGGLLLAVLASAVVLVAPGYALTRVFWMSGTSDARHPLTGVLLGLALLPVIDSVLTRFCGLDLALGINLLLAIVAGGLAARAPGGMARPSRVTLVLLGCWLVLLTIEWVDFDVAGKLYQPLTVFDAVKHAATTQAIFDSGAPPRDAFFLRPERASYYYFFYTLAALVERLGGGLVDSKAAVGGLAFWTGVGAYGLVRVCLQRAGLAVSRPSLIVAVMAAGGLDCLAVLFFAWSRHYWVADPLQWNEQVGAWLEDVLWVPHHVTALIAGTIACVILCDAMGASQQEKAPRMPFLLAPIAAGLAFASTLGLSIWVTLGFGVTVLAWIAILLIERRWRALLPLLLAGLVALVFAAPQLLDLAAGRAGAGPFPIVAEVRGFTPAELLVPPGPIRFVARLLALPLNYAFEFGVLSLGSAFFWFRRRPSDGGGEFARVLVIAAASGLLVGGFLRSTLFNNDLGWRVMLLPLLAGTVWTIAVLDRPAVAPSHPRRVRAPAFSVLLCLGWATVLYMAVVMRAYPFMTVNPSARFMAADPATERGLRVAYGWAATHLPSTAVVQQDPTKRRAFAFGVYGRHQIAIADSFASLYGADPAAVMARLDAVGPIFRTSLSVSDVGARAAANGIDDLIVTAADPVWSEPGSFVWRVKPIFESDRVRIIPVVTLEAAR